MKKKELLCAQILDLENEIEIMSEQKISGIKEKRKQLSALKSRLKKMEQTTAIHSSQSTHTWENIMNIPYIHLKPACYSKVQTIDDIINVIDAYPEQLCDVEKGEKGLIIEFISFDGPDYGQPVGTLSELVKEYNVSLFKVSTRDGDDIIIEGDKSIPQKFIIIPSQRNSK